MLIFTFTSCSGTYNTFNLLRPVFEVATVGGPSGINKFKCYVYAVGEFFQTKKSCLKGCADMSAVSRQSK
jgi:hypothetical protein